jgi:hypothetical protein
VATRHAFVAQHDVVVGRATDRQAGAVHHAADGPGGDAGFASNVMERGI